MNLYLLQMIGKWFTIIAVSLFSFISNLFYQTTQIVLQNNNQEKSVSVVTTLVEHDTIVRYSDKLPSQVKKVIQPGENGISYTQNGKIQLLTSPITEIIEIGTGKKGEYKGTMTAYGPDCKGCTGVLACPTENGKWLNLYDSIYYQDKEYGNVRILAADHQLFPCGTVIEINSSTQNKVVGIVMDTGYQMRKSWREDQHVWVDLATPKNDHNAYKMTNHNTKYSVKRWGF